VGVEGRGGAEVRRQGCGWRRHGGAREEDDAGGK